MSSLPLRISSALPRRALLLGCGLLATTARTAPVEYHATSLGPISTDVIIHGMNSLGQVAFTAVDPNDASYARPMVTTPDGGSRDLGFLWHANGTSAWSGAVNSYSGYAVGLNDSGVIVGGAKTGTTGNPVLTAFRTVPGNVGHAVSLDPSAAALGIASIETSSAYAVNAAGTAVGIFQGNGQNNPIPFRWAADGSLTCLPVLYAPNPSAIPFAINDSGVCAGLSTVDNVLVRYSHAVVWQNGVCTDLGTLGGMDSYAIGINNSGWIVGAAENISNANHAFRKAPASASLEDLGVLNGTTSSEAHAINAQGTIVGNSGSHAFIWDATHGMRDLDQLDDTGVAYDHAYSINDRGFILAHAGPTAYLLRPVGWAGRWHPIAASVGWDAPRILWYDNTSLSLAAWRCSPDGAFLAGGLQTGFPADWALADFKSATNSTSIAFWRGTGTNTGKAALWILDAAGRLAASREYPTASGWEAQLATTDPISGGLRLLYRHAGDNTYALWTCDAAGNFLSNLFFGPGGTLSPIGMATDSNRQTWTLWNDSLGNAQIWRDFNPVYLGANSEWIPKYLTVAGTEPYIWWERKADGLLAFWHCNTSGQFVTGGTITPPAGWGLYDVSTNWSLGGQTLFWVNFNNETAVWNLDAAGRYLSGSATGIIGAD